MAMRSEEEIDAVLDEGLPDGAFGQSRWPEMTYERGVEAALLWVTGRTDHKPLDD